MSNLLLCFICFSFGIFFRKKSILPEFAPKVLNQFILYISLPALTLYHVHEIQYSSDLLLPAVMPWIVFTVALVTFYLLGKWKSWSQETVVCLVFTAGLGNTSFVGFPLLETYLGKESLAYGILADQLGTFLVLSFPGLILAALVSGGNLSVFALVRRVFQFFPIYAIFLAVLLRPILYPEEIKTILLRLGDTLTPLALVSVGFQLDLKSIKGFRMYLFYGLLFKLVLAPILIYSLYKSRTNNDLLFKTIVFESAMAPMITSSILAIEKDFNPRLAVLMLGIGIPLSFVSTAFLYLLFQENLI